MEDKQKVYIKGDTKRGAEIIKLLQDLGGKNTISYNGKIEDAYYFINPDGIIDSVFPLRSGAFPFIKEFYKEINLPEIKKWKDGILLVKSLPGDKKEYAVYSGKKAKFDDEMLPYVYIYNDRYDTMAICEITDFTIASKDDINDFQNILHQYGKAWSFKKKKLIEWKWKPKNDEEYWFINDLGEICHSLFSYFLERDNKRVKIGNCFQTKLEALNARNKIAKAL